MTKTSAGLLVYRHNKGGLEVLLVHPGGPFFTGKDIGVWSIPKGEYEEGEEPLSVARREFEEETGNRILEGRFTKMRPVRLKSGKQITAWAVEGDFEQCFLYSNEFEMEWPPHSGRKQRFPEVDKADWFLLEAARGKINPGQVPLLDELEELARNNNDVIIHKRPHH